MYTSKRIKLLWVFIFFCFFSGCAGKKIIIESYTAPREYRKIEGMISYGASERTGEYLAIGINPDVISKKKGNDIETLKKLLINDVKAKITETNFITLHPIYDISAVALIIEILDYHYERGNYRIDSNLVVNFVISRGMTEYYSKSYSAKENRHSKSEQGLPGKQELLKKMSQKCAKLFVKDISPIKTKQLRELKSLPGDIEYVLDYAIIKNYEGAIKAMEAYTGKKTMNFYYNLAVFYEALASEKEDLNLLVKADKNYQLSMQNGGSRDDVVISAKARFDNFYKLLKMILEQQDKNEQISEEIGVDF